MRKIKLFMMLALLVAGVSGAWAETVTFSYTDFSGQGTSGTGSTITSTKNGITVSSDKGYTPGSTNRHFRIYTGGKLTIASEDFTITNVSITFSSNSYTNLSGDGFSVSNTTGIWTGNANSVELTANAQVRIYQLTITFENLDYVFYTWTSSLEGVDGGLEVINSSISYTFNSNSYTSNIGGPTELASGSSAIYVSKVPYFHYTQGSDTYNLPYYFYNYLNGGSQTVNPGPITSSNVNTYIRAKAVTGYTAQITAVERANYSNVNNIVISYTPSTHIMYYTVQYNTGAPDDKGFSMGTTSLEHNTTLSRSGNSITASTENNSNYAPTLITWANVDNVIIPTQVEGYTTKVIASGGSGTQSDPYIITINYTNGWAPEGSDLAYSTFHVESTGHQYSMPAGQVAVSLNLTPTAPHYAEESITDIVSFTEAKATEMGLTLTSGASTTVQRDDDGDGVGTETTYVSKGQWGKDSGDESDDNYYFERTHTVAVNTVTQLTIPNTVELDGQIYTVTAIQKWGFAYVASDQNDREYCRELQDPNFGIQEGGYNKTVDFIYRDNINDHRNDYLQKITFDSECPITSFGDYCFMSNNKLGEITIPKNVEYLGTGVFECCKSLKNIYFQRNKSYNSEYTQANYPDGYTKIKNIKLWTFWHCTALESIDFPDGIVEIEGTSLGSPLQYVFALINVRLPNTLEHIGPHFLCDAMSLKTLTIPASVTYINGACFHGCESLETVYLMGPASTLDINAEAGETFAANASYCGQHVQNCQFLTSSEYLPGYQQSSSWSEIDEQGKTDGSTYTNAGGNSVTCLYGNRLSSIPDHTVTLEKDKWVTIIFPYGLPRTTLVENLGAGTMVAQMTKAARDKEADPTHYMYHLTFTLIDTTNGIPAQTPYMICPAQTGTVPLYTAAQASSPEFLQEATKLHAVQVEADDDQGEPKAFVTMNGQYNPYMLLPWDFYFMYDKRAIAGTDHLGDGKAKFWRVRNQSEAPTVGGCKCYWSVWYEGIKQQIGGAKAVDNFFDEGVNAIENVENVQMDIEGIYDLQGRKLNISQDALPQGLYIVNGKKVVVK